MRDRTRAKGWDREEAQLGPAPPRLRARLVGDGALLLAALIWGATFVVVRSALDDCSPLVFIALRFSLATALLAPWVLARHGLPDARALRAGAIVGAWLFLGFALQTVGLLRTPPARAAFLTGLYVVLVPVLLVAFYRRLPTTASLSGVALATSGLVLLTDAGRGGFTWSDLLVVGCAAAFALQILAVDQHGRAVDPVSLLLVEIAVVSILAWPAAVLAETPRWPRTLDSWSAVAQTGVLATLVALGAQNWAQKRTPPTRTAVILALEPVFAAAVSFVVTGERFGPIQLVGSALILAGMLVVELAAGRRLRR